MYEGLELPKMIPGLFIGQLVSIIFWNHIKLFQKQIFKILFLVIAGTLSFLSIAGTVAMTFEYCAEYTSYWIINFMILVPLDFFIFQPIIGYMYYRYKVNVQILNISTSTIRSDNLEKSIDEAPIIVSSDNST